MLGVVYTINKDASGVILVCPDCPHTEHVNQFDDRLCSRRPQAARALLKHVRNEHGKEPIGSPRPQIMARKALSLARWNRPRENLLWVVLSLYTHVIGIGTVESHRAGKGSG